MTGALIIFSAGERRGRGEIPFVHVHPVKRADVVPPVFYALSRAPQGA